MDTNLKFPGWFWWVSLLTAWAVDLLFWGKAAGISLFIWVALALCAGWLLAWKESVRPSRWSFVLAGMALVFAVLFAWRAEAFTRLSAFGMTFGALVLLAATFRTGNWVMYRVWDDFLAGLKVFAAGLSRPLMMQVKPSAPAPIVETDSSAFTPTGRPSLFKRLLPVLRGLVLAVPIVAILAALLASADPIFNARLGDLIKIFDLENLPATIFRLVYILVIGYVLCGVFLHALHPSSLETRPDPHQPFLKPFLGLTEAVVVLVAVDVLFLVFVAIQSWYLFGGQANITTTGYTYADYARRGFSELVAVAVLSLALYLTLNSVTRRTTAGQRTLFSGLVLGLMALVLVILASSLQRLLMYVNAYGFSQLRTHTLVFILWLGVLLLTAIVLEATRRSGHFALALLVVVTGFALSLGLLNVDGFIAQQNIDRARQGAKLDVAYLATLSEDADPVMVNQLRAGGLPATFQDELGAELACRAARMAAEPVQPWPALTISRAAAAAALRDNAALWQAYPVAVDGYQLKVKVNGIKQDCSYSSFMD